MDFDERKRHFDQVKGKICRGTVRATFRNTIASITNMKREIEKKKYGRCCSNGRRICFEVCCGSGDASR